ncbi:MULTISPECIES: hypothetical protein [Serratia]|uniref:hypothetical protein n=1 Tax=Serratia TaxID=613 RepID=UPI0014956CF9|nr:hypothetical protein [Serratia marcescens]
MTDSTIKAAQQDAIDKGLNPKTLLPYTAGWERPTGDDMRVIMTLAGFTGSAAGNYAGVEGRTIRKWIAGAPGPTYAGWCLLVYAAGLGMIPPQHK